MPSSRSRRAPRAGHLEPARCRAPRAASASAATTRSSRAPSQRSIVHQSAKSGTASEATAPRCAGGIEGPAEPAAGLGQQPLPALGAHHVGEVLDDVDRESRRAVLARDRRRLDARPAQLAVRAARAHGHRGPGLAGQRAAARELLRRDRRAVVAQRLEARAHLVDRARRAMAARVRVAEQLERGGVGVDDLAVGALGDDRVRDRAGDRLELVARAPRLALGVAQLGVEPRVPEGHRAAVGQLLGDRDVVLLERAALGRGGEREVADHGAARAQRHDDGRAEADPAQQPQLLRVLGDRLQHLLVHLGHERRLAGPDHRRRAERRSPGRSGTPRRRPR